MIEEPRPPSGYRRDDLSLSSLQKEIGQMRQDIAFLKDLLEHLRDEFSRLKQQ